MADTDIMKMKVADLKRELKNRGLNIVGNKTELQERLQNAILESGDHLEDTTISEDLLEEDEDVLNSVDDDDLDEKSLLEGHEEAILRTPPKDEEKSLDIESLAEKPAPKKVSLKRNVSISAPILPVASEKSTETANDTSDSDATAKKVIKLTELTMEERKNLRAQKFGAAAGATTVPAAVLTSDAKKNARAARFGLAAGGGETKDDAITATATTASAEALKKRAERFGVTVSTELQKLENKDKMAKRQERFGASAAAGKITGPQDYAEKARLRAERFKTTA